MTEVLTHDDCLDGPEGCRGKVEYRMALSASGRPFPRCTLHWEKRLDTQERLDRDYPDSPFAPSWFSEADAGERWNDDY
jgi:hypothetical protein